MNAIRHDQISDAADKGLRPFVQGGRAFCEVRPTEPLARAVSALAALETRLIDAESALVAVRERVTRVEDRVPPR